MSAITRSEKIVCHVYKLEGGLLKLWVLPHFLFGSYLVHTCLYKTQVTLVIAKTRSADCVAALHCLDWALDRGGVK